MKIGVLSAVIIVLIVFLALLIIYMQIKDHFSQDDPMIQKLKRYVEQIAPEAASKIRIYKGEKSYTINKRNVYLCLKDENGNYYDEQILRNIVTHEISHVLSKSIGHTEEFDQIFQNLLKKAEKMNLYDPKVIIPQDYCQY